MTQLTRIVTILLTLSALQYYDCSSQQLTAQQEIPFNKIIASNHCTKANQTEILANSFLSHNYDNSGCPQTKWKDHLYSIDGPQNRVYINVGINKGYNFGDFLHSFAPWTGVHSGIWGAALAHIGKRRIRRRTGACNEGFFKPHIVYNKSTPIIPIPYIHLIGMDLNMLNLHVVREVMQWLRNKDSKTLHNIHDRTLHVKGIYINIHFKYSNIVSYNSSCFIVSSIDSVSEMIPSCEAGDELCGATDAALSEHIRRPNISVQSSSIDTIVTKLRMSKEVHLSTGKIDLLQIDTEGNDMHVIRGASQLLQRKEVRVLIFEYHSVGDWRNTLLKDIIADLWRLQYFCYFEGQEGRLWAISDRCWTDLYEFHRWSNVACFDVEDEWFVAVQRFVVREPPW